MKKLFSAFLLAGVLITGAATAANAQLYRDYCNWPMYSPYAGYNPNFVQTSSFTYGTTKGDYIRSGWQLQPVGSPYWDAIPITVKKSSRPLMRVDLF